MADTTFLKTVTFGGYDKQSVEERFKSLCLQISELKNELREAKLSLVKYKTGADSEKVHESVIKEERERLSQLQTENEIISEKLKALECENAQKDEKIKTLESSVSELEHVLSESDMKIASLQAKDDVTALSVVFAEAKKSATMITETARKQAEELKEDSKKLAENTLAEANNKAAEIVYEAEAYAAEMMAEVENQTSDMKNASGNLKSLLLDDVKLMSEKMSELKKFFENSEKILSDTMETLEKDGVPVFKKSEKVKPDLPEKPVYEKTDYTYNATKNEKPKNKKSAKKEQTGLAEERIYSDNYHYDDDADMPNFEQLNAGIISDYEIDVSGLAKTQRSPAMMRGGIDLEALTKQAEEFVGMKKKSGNTQNMSMNLDEIAQMAAEIDDKPTEKKSSESMNLDEIAQMAAEIDDKPTEKKSSESMNLDEIAQMAAEIDDKPTEKKSSESMNLDEIAKMASEIGD